jgi:phage/plasmid-associated DNA primase
MLLKVDKIVEHVDTKFAQKLVAEEGPAIMMWFIQHAMEGWQELQRTGSFYGTTKDKARAAAMHYKEESSPHLAWIEEEGLVVEHGARMNAHEAYRSFRAFMKEENRFYTTTKKEFRKDLSSLPRRQISYGRFGDELVFFGLRVKEIEGGNVVKLFPAVNEKPEKPETLVINTQAPKNGGETPK